MLCAEPLTIYDLLRISIKSVSMTVARAVFVHWIYCHRFTTKFLLLTDGSRTANRFMNNKRPRGRTIQV